MIIYIYQYLYIKLSEHKHTHHPPTSPSHLCPFQRHQVVSLDGHDVVGVRQVSSGGRYPEVKPSGELHSRHLKALFKLPGAVYVG